ncbi:MAG: protein translocase subunit SecD [Roseburia sp.]|nr:protein translocase subunit SecD [Roseburia sp.]MCM1279678.1 protein translocase subunit SecD [Robinsoniella sp.]
MKKSRAALVLIATVLVMGLLAYTSIIGFGPTKTGSAANIKQGLDLAGGVSITYEVVGEEEADEADMADTVYKLQKRVEKYSTEAQVYREGSKRINIEIPGVSDANTILEELGQPGSLYFIAQTGSDGTNNYGYGIDENGAVLTDEDGAPVYVLNKSIAEIEADGGIVLTGTDVKNAEAGQISDDMKNNEIAVQLTLTSEGTKKFADATTKAYQNGESIGIYYDGAFVSVPSVNSPIPNGEASITGMKDFEEAERLASTIRIGGLKLELKELRSNVVGAQLGEEALKTSLLAGVVGLVIVMVFMTVVYLLPGFVSAIALLIYTGLTLVALNAFDITLTLPGIAGIILSIGMAVDANVIIFARVKEELGTGKTVSSAIKIGFQKAFSAIIDGNITTLIAALVLGIKGSGTVKGFAQTLGLGIVLSMFTALVITRLLINAVYALGLKNEKLYGSIKERKSIDFLSKKAIFISISLVVIVAGFVFMGINKVNTGDMLNYSLEFKGGTSTNVTFNEDLSIADIDSNVVPVVEEITGDANVQTQKVTGTNEVIIKTRTLSVEEREAFNQAMVDHFGVDAEKITAETISAAVSDEMKMDAIVAVIVATICMLIYIWFRFSDIRFAASAVLALCHDVLVVLAFYAVAKISVGNTFIACMLTIVGYSINATIVIFDRIREHLAGGKGKGDLKEVVNSSITQTLTRSIYTSLTTFVMVAALYVFGVTSIREFALPLMAGIICGAYSSVCITGALWYLMKTKMVKGKKK